MKTIKYRVSGCFDIEREIKVEDDEASDFEIWLAIICDLERRGELNISYKRVEELK